MGGSHVCSEDTLKPEDEGQGEQSCRAAVERADVSWLIFHGSVRRTLMDIISSFCLVGFICMDTQR